MDTGIDDAMALMFALRHPEIDVRAITCVAGNTSLDNVVANTLRILDLVGAPQIPVAGGALCPLIESSRDASWVHGATGLGSIVLPASTRTPQPVHAIELMRRTIVEASEPMTLVSLAPMTNLALLLRMHPEVTGNLERIVFMGGSAVGGNASAVAEFNVWHDPEAAHIVLSSGVPLMMYGLDVFDAVEVPAQRVAPLHTMDSEISRTLGALIDHEAVDPASGATHSNRLIGDAGALCAMVAPELFGFERRPVHVELAPGFSRGQTLVDRRAHGGESAIHGAGGGPWPLVDVTLTCGVTEVLDLFFGIILREQNVLRVPVTS
ncbi:nucleoside hydrolase [Brachybacterium vulturis]|uniref:nucleoside hydrolase n=1 Tax=Brachybacterium vulturis TaxID=2017484 RepID=UPI001C43C799|nr:nucleoside hydrolase [Brachybacterium vulturis]